MFLIYFVPLLSIFYFLYTRLTSALAKLPGPFYTRLTSGYLKVKEFTGNRRLYVHALHETYGPVVRLSPNEVSFASLEAMKEIYTSGGSGYDRTEFYELFKQFGTKYVSFSRSALDNRYKKCKKRCIEKRVMLTANN